MQNPPHHRYESTQGHNDHQFIHEIISKQVIDRNPVIISAKHWLSGYIVHLDFLFDDYMLQRIGKRKIDQTLSAW